MDRLGRVFGCRLLNSHKWERVQTRTEEAYKCKRCGMRRYGPLLDPNMGEMSGGGGGAIGG